MGYKFALHPTIGVARVGNSPADFYLAPDRMGGLPIECDDKGNSSAKYVRRFKDSAGRIRRQGARFVVYRYDDSKPLSKPEEVTLDSPDIVNIEWTVHLANKKACWYEFLPQIGNDMLGPENTYEKQNVPLRNGNVKGKARKRLIIDPGPRLINGREKQIDFSESNVSDYPNASFPPMPTQGHQIKTLGELRTDRKGRLVVLGGYGYAGGDTTISGYAGADTWYDDISDGPVSCRLTFQDGTLISILGWVIVGAPKVAPELVNIITLDDIIFDLCVRFKNLVPNLCYRDMDNPDPYCAGRFDFSYKPNYKRDIEPIIRRPLNYVWVAIAPSMAAFASPSFDPKDSNEENRSNRETYLKYFRPPGEENELFSKNGSNDVLIPMMPLNSGSNSVKTNNHIQKFLSLTETQYFLMKQWASGNFTTEEPLSFDKLDTLDRASVGNCVGSPMCPGIEVTWNLRNPKIYETPYTIKHAHNNAYYRKHGLDPRHDETTGKGKGCEPGDLTKRMAIPWQADFFNCTSQFINFTDPKVNKDENNVPVPPTYYSFWWPPQSPVNVIANQLTIQGQKVAGVMAGYPVYYQRGLNSYADVIDGWSYLAFIINLNSESEGELYPYFIEQERNEDEFTVADIAIGGAGNLITANTENFTPFWILNPYSVRKENILRKALDADVGKPIRRSVRRDHR